MSGWECPVCHIGVAPDLDVCPNCYKCRQESKAYTITFGRIVEMTREIPAPVSAISRWFPDTTITSED